MKFCILICGEFRCESGQGNVCTVGALLAKNTYDYVLHSTIGGDIFDAMLKHSRHYIHSDSGNANKVIVGNMVIAEEDLVGDTKAKPTYAEDTHSSTTFSADTETTPPQAAMAEEPSEGKVKNTKEYLDEETKIYVKFHS